MTKPEPFGVDGLRVRVFRGQREDGRWYWRADRYENSKKRCVWAGWAHQEEVPELIARRRNQKKTLDVQADKSAVELAKELADGKAHIRLFDLWFCKGTLLNRCYKFGLTLEQAIHLLKATGGVCRICKRKITKARFFAFDHDHRTGRLRGVICTKCNLLLGSADDTIEILRNAADYLQNRPDPTTTPALCE